jgi:hypothetical protein
MSDKFSSASGTISTELTETDLMKCISFNFKLVLYICLIIIIFSLLISCLNSMTMSSLNFDDNLTYESPSMKKIVSRCKCGKYCNMNGYYENFDNENEQSEENVLEINKENFSNDELYSYKKQQFANYTSIPLLPPFDEFKNPINLFFGQANRYIQSIEEYRLEIFCNLLVLDGNIYDVAKRGDTNQKYLVYLLNDKTNKKMKVGPLYKDGDGIYKMKITLKDNIEELLSYNKIIIVYSLDNQEQILLEGSFK